MSSIPKLYRLQTYHGTQVYLDPQGRLRHGQSDANPDNVRAQAFEAQLVLWHDAGADGFRGLGFPCAPDGSLIGPAAGQDGSEVVSGEPQVFDIDAEGVVIGLRYHGTYLCSEPDGRVVLNREAFGGWERFDLIEVAPAPPPAVVEEPLIEELTLEQLAIEPPVIDASAVEEWAVEAPVPHEPTTLPPPGHDWLTQAMAQAEPEPLAVHPAERLAASSTEIGYIKVEPPRPGLWRRFMRSLLGD